MQVTALVPPVQLLNVFPVTILGVAIPESPSEFEIPLSVVAPVTVILEKLLFVCVMVASAATVLVPELKHVTVPPAPVLLNAVTIELLLIV